ncbi:MAG TPA: hypothetical protein VLV83_24815 [Acidobacteriota bacterium]|nr:hypothetical protein [Acidobacteriota bacterium]
MRIRIWIAALTVLLLTGAALAQEGQFTMKAPEGERLMLPGMILYFADDEASGEVKLGTVLNLAQQGGATPTAYSELDMKQGDVLMMMDAMPVPSAKEFMEYYQQAEVGAEISLGLRGESGDIKVVTFKKPDPSELPQMRMMRREDLTPEQLEQLKKSGKIMIKKPEQKPEEKTPPPGGLR